jgi:hypothetical protein
LKLLIATPDWIKRRVLTSIPVSLPSRDIYGVVIGGALQHLASVAQLHFDAVPDLSHNTSHLSEIKTRTVIMHQQCVQTSIDQNLADLLKAGQRIAHISGHISATIFADLWTDTYTALFRIAAVLPSSKEQIRSKDGWWRLHHEVRLALDERGSGLLETTARQLKVRAASGR